MPKLRSKLVFLFGVNEFFRAENGQKRIFTQNSRPSIMPSDCIPFQETGYFSKLICDYLDRAEALAPFYERFPSLENFEGQMAEKASSFSTENRKTLVEALSAQYQHLEASKKTLSNIAALADAQTFTITTGHQLNLFTGPLYFLYKIVSTINLCKELSKKYTTYRFVPVYWMATEDHDFDEINFFNYHGKKFQWNRNSSGAVGELSTDGLEDVLELFSLELGNSQHAQALQELFQKAYLNHPNLADATRFLANALFADEGLVIVDGNDAKLKRLFIPYLKQEVFEQTTFKAVSETSAALKEIHADYPIQVTPREINLFYLDKSLRERLVEENGRYRVLETELSFTKEALSELIESHPERFSPNVITRPLYQEVILPNLCYIGGGGELAYWFQLKTAFATMQVPFPILLLRNSALLVSRKQMTKLEKLDIPIKKLFLKRNDFINRHVRKISNIEIDFTEQKEHLSQQFEALYALAEQTDKSFLGAVKAQEVKQLKGLAHLEKRLLKGQKRKLKDQVARAVALQEQLFPQQNLQERVGNFSEFYQEIGLGLIPLLLDQLKPLELQFQILHIN